MRAILVNTLFLAKICFTAPPAKYGGGTQVENMIGIKSEADSNLTFYAIDGSFTKLKTTNVPYETKSPYMVFNKELNQLEVFGDWRTAPRKAHQASLHHYFYDYDTDIWTDNTLASYYEGENQGVAVYTDEIGTVLLNGWSWTYSIFVSNCYQVSLPKSFNDVSIAIPDLPNAMDNFGGKYYNSKIYISGGYYQEEGINYKWDHYPTALYYLDLNGISSSDDVISSWAKLGSLSKPGMPLEIEIFNNILYAFNGISDKAVYNVGVETYNLDSGETEYIDNVLNFGRYHGAYVLTNSNQGSVIDNDPMLTLLGGELYPDCKTNSSVQCNTAEQGAVGFENVGMFSLINNPDWTTYEDNYLASVKFYAN